MKRRHFLQQLGAALPLSLFGSAACAAGNDKHGRLQHPGSYWKPLLGAAAYKVLFEEDTEPPRSSPLDKQYGSGTYVCAACHQPLFTSSRKFDSGTGWPSFWQPLKDAVGTKSDRLLFVERTEYHCARCGGHQGHVFEDGPPPTGLRYCNNGLALRFVPQGQSLPELRG